MEEGKKYNIIIEGQNEMLDYVNRLVVDVESRLTIITRMLDSHAADNDVSVFNSVPWKHYHKEFEEVNAEYMQAKDQLSEKVIKPIVYKKEGKEIDFTWKIVSFTDGICEITILGE